MVEITNEGAQLMLQFKDLVWLAGVVAVVLTTIMEKASKKFKPWSWLAKQFGKVANAEILDEVKKLGDRVDKIEKANKKQDERYEQDKAVDARRRIIAFADECRRGIKHSSEMFNSALDDITFYENYCDAHKGFKNEKAKASIEVVRSVYHKVFDANDFL